MPRLKTRVPKLSRHTRGGEAHAITPAMCNAEPAGPMLS